MSAIVQPSSRVADIAKAIYAAAAGISADDDAVRDAQGKVLEAADAKQAGRIGVLVTVGRLSSHGAWTDAEIGMAVTQVVGGSKTNGMANNPAQKKALQTFASDLKAAMHPNVRDRVASIHALCEQVWSAEAESKDGPRPCKKAFQRQYHMLKSALVGAKDGSVVLHGPSDVIFWATQNDPDFNPTKVMKQLEGVAATIDAIAANFPITHFESIKGFLTEISEAGLKAARDELIHKQDDLTASHTLAPIPTTVVSAPAAAPVLIPTHYEEDEAPEVEEIDPTAAWLADDEAA